MAEDKIALWNYAAMHGWTVQAVYQRLEALVRKHGSLRKAAKRMGLSAAFLSDVRLGRREPGPRLCAALKLRKVVKVERTVKYIDNGKTKLRRRVAGDPR